MLNLKHFVTQNPEIQRLLIKIESNKTALTLIPINKDLVEIELKKGLLKSGLYSARIEGNKLTEETYKFTEDAIAKLEVQNLVDTYTWLQNKQHEPLTIDFVKLLHQKSMHNIRNDAGKFRLEQSAIFDSSGAAIYLTPPPPEILPLLTNWLNCLSTSDQHPLITACISHYQFEKIHPFLDGNGRVGRLILSQLLSKVGYRTELLNLPQHIEQTRLEYYRHLENEKQDLSDFAEYLLDVIESAQTALLTRITSTTSDTHQHLSPRRQEILAIIKDHSPCSADFIYRRFMAIPPSTIRYDLGALQKQGLIKKLGTTRGALYSAT